MLTTRREYFLHLLEGFKRELGLQERLLEIARKKQALLLKNDIEALVPLLEEEGELVFQTCAVERRLGNIWEEMKRRFFPEEQEMSLSRVFELADADLQEEFRALQGELNRVVRELQELNRQNALLIEDVLNYIDVVFSLLLREVERQEQKNSPCYGPPRGEEYRGGVRGILIDGVV
uniref:Flagellar protein FlgN n=1 Tax=Candidatus Caldatribacterium californiense TaxID=1454726 RepID=A0A7V3YMC7_9BACT